uniref:Uncharacterized protein n=1 Tax=Panagrolaimus sp. ES5 TaxID=591445 RepID=A0AC34G046_9BILA
MAAEVVASIVDTLLEGGGQKDESTQNSSEIQSEQTRTKPTLNEAQTYSSDEEPQTITDAVTRQPILLKVQKKCKM